MIPPWNLCCSGAGARGCELITSVRGEAGRGAGSCWGCPLER